MNKNLKLIRLSLFTACALIVFIIEAQIPPVVPIPGIKPGLANAVTLSVLYLMGGRAAFTVLILRIVLGSFFAGTPLTLVYSLSGGISAFIAMVINKKLTVESQIPAVSICGAIFHNLGQLAAAAIIMKTCAVFSYLPWLMLSAVATGIFTGFAALYSVRILKRRF